VSRARQVGRGGIAGVVALCARSPRTGLRWRKLRSWLSTPRSPAGKSPDFPAVTSRSALDPREC